jgi:hypothetical protein
MAVRTKLSLAAPQRLCAALKTPSPFSSAVAAARRAKAAAAASPGGCYLRFDDTNPTAEEQEYIAGLLTQGVLGVPTDPLALRRGPLGTLSR